MVSVKTTLGDFTLQLDEEKAPETVKNFLAYVDAGFYDGTVFHRVIDGFMVQGGGMDRDLNRKPTLAPIKNEAANGLKNDRGTVAMARTSDPNSATSQFFVNVIDNEGLNYPKPDGHGYAVFGKVVDGMAVVDQIKGVPTGIRDGVRDVPVETVEIISITRTPS